MNSSDDRQANEAKVVCVPIAESKSDHGFQLALATTIGVLMLTMSIGLGVIWYRYETRFDVMQQKMDGMMQKMDGMARQIEELKKK